MSCSSVSPYCVSTVWYCARTAWSSSALAIVTLSSRAAWSRMTERTISSAAWAMYGSIRNAPSAPWNMDSKSRPYIAYSCV